jgi:hypothetical protein
MILQPIPSEFSYLGEKFDFLFYQCSVANFFAELSSPAESSAAE